MTGGDWRRCPVGMLQCLPEKVSGQHGLVFGRGETLLCATKNLACCSAAPFGHVSQLQQAFVRAAWDKVECAIALWRGLVLISNQPPACCDPANACRTWMSTSMRQATSGWWTTWRRSRPMCRRSRRRSCASAAPVASGEARWTMHFWSCKPARSLTSPGPRLATVHCM